MKLGILTQPLHSNYGGLLQAWALQTVLSRMGHHSEIIQREFVRVCDLSILRQIAHKGKKSVMDILGKPTPVKPDTHQINIIRSNTSRFLNSRYSGLSPILYTEKSLREYISSQKFDGYVVGSDQVWRPCYSPAICNYYLDFIGEESNVKRIAYAASFGVDFWEYSPKQTDMAKRLAKKFDVITVRESSAVELVKRFLDCPATHVADPTMLLEKEDYESLVEKSTCKLHNSEGTTFCYVLDSSQDVQEVICKCMEVTHTTPYYCNAKRKVSSKEDLNNIEECIFPPVEQWIKSFMDAKMVITDSFHGTVFSIIFNRPFWVVANKNRGTARFTSLLSLFGLEDRLVTDSSKIDWNKPIDWKIVNEKRSLFASKSLSILTQSLK